MTPQEIRELQAALGVPIDGIYGPSTQRAHQAHLDVTDRTAVPNITPLAAQPWWQSRALLGSLAVLGAWVLGRSGWEISSDELTGLLVSIAEAAGAALAIYGTIRNRRPIDPTLMLPGVRLPLPTYRPSPPQHGPGPFDAH